jgi:putative holliday junction resolvase
MNVMDSFPARLNSKGVPEPSAAAVPAGRILALDYGRKRIGLAVSDELALIARPLPTLARTNRRNDLRRLKEICRKNDIALLIVGLPLHIAGEESDMGQEASRFAARLEKALGIPVRLLDERLTSWEAERTAAETRLRSRRKHEDLDSLAAAVLLRDYLSLKRGESLPSAAAKE